ncbi:UDP-N-acetylglucosamine 2-epimerase (non-hydrolyzing) [Candidatus Poribacteria bacterium]|nr:UDP-N-acetylglucosamine 2-epimerase (non-hydrolyzing) [Candidatus Poribacteria bacterium]
MKVVTVLGTRPEIIRLSAIIPKLDGFTDQILVHTGQNYDNKLSEIFFSDLGVREPDYHLDIDTRTFGSQLGDISAGCEEIFRKTNPDAVLVLGDTNSGLSAIIAKRMGIPVYHMEAGNRCYDDRVPEEVNRRIIDHSSSILMPYTDRSKENLVMEGILPRRIHVIGNPIFEVLNKFSKQIDSSSILEKLNLKENEYFLATLHRAENVDLPDRLKGFSVALKMINKKYGLKIIVSTHPRTRSKLSNFGLENSLGDVEYMEPMRFFDFVCLEKNAKCVLSDSGTVQEECCIFGVSTITLRDVTERPETIDCGSNVLSGGSPEKILYLTGLVTESKANWIPPKEYVVPDVSSTVLRIITGYCYEQ